MTKHEVYEKQIKPLLAQLAEICEKHDLPFLGAAHLDEDRVKSVEANACIMSVIYYLPDQNPWAIPDKFRACLEILQEKDESRTQKGPTN